MCTKKNDQVSLKEIRETFYRLRNFEISSLWQRSIFLSALLVLFFFRLWLFGVKAIWKRDLKSLDNSRNLLCNSFVSHCFFHNMDYDVQGFKAWYEVYERRICDIEKEKNLNIPIHYRMGKDCRSCSLDSNLITTKSGRYSVLKLNILIGIILMITWTMILIMHYIGAICSLRSPNSNYYSYNHISYTRCFFLFIVITATWNLWAKSTSLSSPKESNT